jgi:hypothetical protein
VSVKIVDNNGEELNLAILIDSIKFETGVAELNEERVPVILIKIAGFFSNTEESTLFTGAIGLEPLANAIISLGAKIKPTSQG